MIVFKSKPLLLLCSLLLLLIVSPVIELTQWRELIITGSFTIILLSLVRLVWADRKLQFAAGTLAVFAAVLLWAGEAFPPDAAWLWGEVLYICLSVIAILVALTRIVSSEVVDRDVLVGAVAVYLLIGITWSLIYSLLYAIEPGSFGEFLDSEHGYWNQFVYFSFTTLTTLGYGDIVALNPFVRTLSILEAITGVMFEAVIIARLVGLYRNPPTRPGES